MPRIALDAMGGDYAPTEAVFGALDAARDGVDVVLVGDEGVLGPILDGAEGSVPIVHASQAVGMGEDPGAAVRDKKDSSVVVAAQMVAAGDAAGFVSAGSTGAAMTVGALIVGRLPGVKRPAIASVFPTGTIVIDSGANLECKPEHFVQFGVMGSVLASILHGSPAPRVGLINIGEEPGKGRDIEKLAYAAMAEAPFDFVGNVEGRDLATDRAEVIVADGFTGNILLKAAEGSGRFILEMWSEIIAADPVLQEAAVPFLPSLAELRRRLDPENYGGAHLVGVNGVVVIAHGSSSRVAFANALRMASRDAGGGLVRRIADGIAAAG